MWKEQWSPVDERERLELVQCLDEWGAPNADEHGTRLTLAQRVRKHIDDTVTSESEGAYDQGFAECRQRVIDLLRHDQTEPKSASILSALSDVRRAVASFRPHNGMDYGDGEGTVEQENDEAPARHEREPYAEALQPVIAEVDEAEYGRAIEALADVVNDLIAQRADHRIEQLSGEMQGLRQEVRGALHNLEKRFERISESAKAVGYAAAKAGRGHP